jgi:FixJ family two-component response regulator
MTAERVHALTPRYKQIARLASERGLTRKEIAHEMGISLHTLRNHISGHPDHPGLFGIVGAHSMRDVIIWFWRDGGKELCEEE